MSYFTDSVSILLEAELSKNNAVIFDVRIQNNGNKQILLFADKHPASRFSVSFNGERIFPFICPGGEELLIQADPGEVQHFEYVLIIRIEQENQLTAVAPPTAFRR